jgi:hypothetical protein
LSMSNASLTSWLSFGLNIEFIWSTDNELAWKWLRRMSGVTRKPFTTTPWSRRRRLRNLLKMCFQSLSQVRLSLPTCKSMKVKGARRG